MKIAAAVAKNDKLLKLGIFLDVPAARIKVQEAIQANNDAGMARLAACLHSHSGYDVILLWITLFISFKMLQN